MVVRDLSVIKTNIQKHTAYGHTNRADPADSGRSSVARYPVSITTTRPPRETVNNRCEIPINVRRGPGTKSEDVDSYGVFLFVYVRVKRTHRRLLQGQNTRSALELLKTTTIAHVKLFTYCSHVIRTF